MLIDRPIPGGGQIIQSSLTVTLTVDFMRAVGTEILFASAIPDHIGKTLA
jgi:acyl-coenzyme A thioesterase PaaI-like protein